MAAATTRRASTRPSAEPVLKLVSADHEQTDVRAEHKGAASPARWRSTSRATTCPLEKMADSFQIGRIQNDAQARHPASKAAAAPAGPAAARTGSGARGGDAGTMTEVARPNAAPQSGASDGARTPDDEATLAHVRPSVRRILTSSRAFQALPPEEQRSIATEMVKVAQYMANPDGLAAQELAPGRGVLRPRPRPTCRETPGLRRHGVRGRRGEAGGRAVRGRSSRRSTSRSSSAA